MDNIDNRDLLERGSIKNRWTQLEGLRTELTSRAEQYAGWTLPYILPPMHMKDAELQSSMDSIGAQVVNHLANKIIKVLFRPWAPFFRLDITPRLEKEIMQRAGDPAAIAELKGRLDPQFAATERDAMKELETMAYRTAAVEAAKSLIITGNTMIYHPEKGDAVTYNLRDFCVLRDTSGFAVEMMTKDTKAFETFNEDVQAALLASHAAYKEKGDPKNECSVYTLIKLEDDGKYHVYQSAEDVTLNVHAVFPVDLCPWLALTWNLSKSENYGRGLVEDYAGAFHFINMLTLALTEGGAISCDIKFLVDPASPLDVQELNASKSGSYHQGKEGDITTPEMNKVSDFQFILALIERFERMISMGFTYQQGTTRDAERVTAVEIRRDAQELDESFGGVYSKFSEKWQRPVARLILDKMGSLADKRLIDTRIVTGMDSLSRLGDLDNLQMFLNDLAMLNEVPEDVRARMKISNLIVVVGTARSVDYAKFIMTEEQYQQEQQRQLAMQKQLMATQGQTDVAVEAGKQAVKE
jgi:hypothetical protein